MGYNSKKHFKVERIKSYLIWLHTDKDCLGDLGQKHISNSYNAWKFILAPVKTGLYEVKIEEPHASGPKNKINLIHKRKTEENDWGRETKEIPVIKWLFVIIMIWEKAKVKIRIALESLIFLKELRFFVLFSVDVWAKTILFLPLA